MPCKLSFQQWEEKLTIEFSRSDITYSEFMDLVDRLVYSVGFSKKDLDQYIIDWGNELNNKRDEK